MSIQTRATLFGIGIALLASSAKIGLAQDSASTFKSAWKAEVSADARRFGVADVTGDQKPRLILLEKDNTVTINAFDGSSVKKEATVDLGKNADQFTVGTFAKGKPAMIAVPGSIFYKDGDKYSKKDSSEVSEITGFVRFVDGTENFFFFGGGGGNPPSYAVDLSGAKLIVPGKEMPDPMAGEGTYSAVVARLPAAVMDMFGAPDEVKKAGFIGFFAPKGNGPLCGLAAWNGKDSQHVGTFDLSVFGGGGGDFKFGWKSPKLDGAVLDFFIGPDPKTGKGVGIYILQKTGPEGKGRAVEYFAVDKG
jgi:hypothetical protein